MPTRACSLISVSLGLDPPRWSIRVSGNWRLTFEFRDGQAYLLDYEDYH
ncbi:type II toxin-antitoxin system RelE/ParE family toxin [Thioalkalivibrio sp. ALMg11]|nr:type II toxin-antitoxin system RelE/ParE family toxin [Thioalkalivibrio sp. ALMg11]